MEERQRTFSPEERVSPRGDLEEGSRMLSQEERDTEPDLQQDLASQQSSRVHTVCPKQPQAELQNVSITGDQNTVIVGHATGTIVNQTGNPNVTGTPSRKQVRAAARKAKKALRNVYTSTGSYVKMLPWLDDDKIHIMDIYTKLRLVEQVDRRGRTNNKEKNMQSYEEMFQFETREKNPIKRVVISGTAGIGKTTLFNLIAYDWAMGNSETLKKYDLVFVLKMRSLTQNSDLLKVVFDQLLDKDSVNQRALKKFIDKNQNKVLILLDGFDEFQTTELDTSSFGSILKALNRKQGTEYWVVITSRPPLDKFVNSSLVEMPYARVKVEGFLYGDVEGYVNKYFSDDHDKASKLTEQIQLSDTLSDLARTPMLLLHICWLWDKENTLPDTMTRLYNKALKFIFKRNEKDITDDAISNILISIGEVALGRLLTKDESFAFREGDFGNSVLSAAKNVGVLTSERKIDDHDDPYQSVSFIHQTFLEFCAAMYWQSLIKTKKTFDRILEKIDFGLSHFGSYMFGPSRLDYLLRFCCGDNEKCTKRILKKVIQDNEPRLAIICYFESQSKEPPPENVISLVLTDNMDISYGHVSTYIEMEYFHFLSCAAVSSRGTNYFKQVKKLTINIWSFHKFVKDFAKSSKQMTNLHSLSLKLCTPAEAEKILLSLPSPSALVKLTLELSEALDGSMSLLAPHLRTFQNLKELRLNRCSLVAQDMSPIAESTGDTQAHLHVPLMAPILVPLDKMTCLQTIHLVNCFQKGKHIEPVAAALSGVSTLVNLILSDNVNLGGCAEEWALHLKKMRHLEKVILCSCYLKVTDIEPIAVALSGMCTLVNLDLSDNEYLGGCAEEWAFHLKTMRHLEEVSLCSCSLEVTDIKPIAEALSGVSTLVNLDLSDNESLGASVNEWASHLDRMSNLKKVTLKSCSLGGTDIEPIAAALSGVSTLVHLDLSANEYLSSCAKEWASHLKKMRHLEEVSLCYCSLGCEDIEPIAVELSDVSTLVLIFQTINTILIQAFVRTTHLMILWVAMHHCGHCI